jgi:serine/threonine protein kinase
MNEYTIGVNINHPNIIKTFDIDLLDNILILEYFGGVDLHTYIVKGTEYDGMDTYEKYFKQLINAVKYLHDKGIAHLDIKPENIIIKKETETLKLIDFGEAVVFRLGENIFKKRGLRGSIAYLPPEAFEDAEYECDKIDIWCCGVVMYNIIFKSMPWKIAKVKDDNNFAIYKKTGIIRGKSELNVMGIILNMLDCNASNRRLHDSEAFEEIEEDTTPKAIDNC